MYPFVGGPDTRTRHWQFIPFDPFLPGGMLWGVLPHAVIGRDRRLVSKREWYGGKFGREAEESESSYRVRLCVCLPTDKTYRARERKKRGGEGLLGVYTECM